MHHEDVIEDRKKVALGSVGPKLNEPPQRVTEASRKRLDTRLTDLLGETAESA